MSGLFITGRRERIRTSDPFVPNEVRDHAALHAVLCGARIYRKALGNASTFSSSPLLIRMLPHFYADD